MEKQKRGGEMQPINGRIGRWIHKSCEVGTVLGGADV